MTAILTWLSTTTYAWLIVRDLPNEIIHNDICPQLNMRALLIPVGANIYTSEVSEIPKNSLKFKKHLKYQEHVILCNTLQVLFQVLLTVRFQMLCYYGKKSCKVLCTWPPHLLKLCALLPLWESSLIDFDFLIDEDMCGVVSNEETVCRLLCTFFRYIEKYLELIYFNWRKIIVKNWKKS